MELSSDCFTIRFPEILIQGRRNIVIDSTSTPYQCSWQWSLVETTEWQIIILNSKSKYTESVAHFQNEACLTWPFQTRYIFFRVIGNIWGNCTFCMTQFFQTTHGQEQQQPCRDIWPCWLNEFSNTKILPRFRVVILGLCVVVVSDSLRSTLRSKFKLSM